MSVGEYLEHWLTVDVERRLTHKTAARHPGRSRGTRSSRGSGTSLCCKLTAVHIRAAEAELQRSGYVKGRKSGQGLTAQTVLHVHRSLSQALAHAVATGVLFKNPAEQVKPPRPPRREVAILSKAEVAAVLRAAEGWIYLPVLVGVTTGMRRGEILGLRWSDIDFKTGRLAVNQSLERVQGKSVLKPPKTPGSRRTITLPALTVEALKAHRATQAAERLQLGLGRPELVFGHAGPQDPDSLSKAFDRLVAGARACAGLHFMDCGTPTSHTNSWTACT